MPDHYGNHFTEDLLTASSKCRKTSTSVSLDPERDLLEMPTVLVPVEIWVCFSFGAALSAHIPMSLSVSSIFFTVAECGLLRPVKEQIRVFLGTHAGPLAVVKLLSIM